jgi:hypothetical protein
MRGNLSRMMWIDSSLNTTADKTHVLVPNHPFSAAGNERIALTLVDFSLRRNWPNIHRNNSVFYLYVDDGTGTQTYHEVSIVAGYYPTFDDILAALDLALATTVATVAELTGAVAAFTDSTRKYEITFAFTGPAAAAGATAEVRCFQLSSGGALPAGVSLLGSYQDVHEILGAKPIRDLNSLTASMTVGATTASSIFPASVNSIDSIMIHMDLETGNFATTSMDAGAADNLRLVESSIFARIQVPRSSFDEAHETLHYTDPGNDAFQVFLNRKSLDLVTFRITDIRGRSLASLDPTQADAGLMRYTMTLRWDLFAPPPTPEPKHAGLPFREPPVV